jgi:hypothetical protein
MSIFSGGSVGLRASILVAPTVNCAGSPDRVGRSRSPGRVGSGRPVAGSARLGWSGRLAGPGRRSDRPRAIHGRPILRRSGRLGWSPGRLGAIHGRRGLCPVDNFVLVRGRAKKGHGRLTREPR